MSANTVRELAIAAARHALDSRFTGAAFAIVAGSIMRGKGMVVSDIDLVVVFDRVPTAWRESFIEHDFPVEAFVQDPETLDWFFDDDVARGQPVLMNMIASGHAIGADLVRAGAPQAGNASSRPARRPCRPSTGTRCGTGSAISSTISRDSEARPRSGRSEPRSISRWPT